MVQCRYMCDRKDTNDDGGMLSSLVVALLKMVNIEDDDCL